MTSTTIVLVVLSACVTSPRTGVIIWRQAVTWHPAAGAGGDTPSPRRLGGGIKGYENHSPKLEEHAARTGTLGAELGPGEQAASGELRKYRRTFPWNQNCQKSYWSLQSFRRCKHMLMSRRRGWEHLMRSRSRTGRPSSGTRRLL